MLGEWCFELFATWLDSPTSSPTCCVPLALLRCQQGRVNQDGKMKTNCHCDASELLNTKLDGNSNHKLLPLSHAKLANSVIICNYKIAAAAKLYYRGLLYHWLFWCQSNIIYTRTNKGGGEQDLGRPDQQVLVATIRN